MMADEDSDSVFGSSVLSRIKAFESHGDNSNNSSRTSSKYPSESSTRSNSRLNSSGHESTEEDWVNVNVGLGGTLGRPTLAPPLPGRKSSSSLSMSSGSLSHAPASSVSSFHSVSLSSDSIAVVSEKEADTASLESEPYEDVDSTTSFGSPGAVARLTADWDQLRQNIPPLVPSRSVSSSSASTSTNRRPPPPPPTSSSTLVGSTSDRSSTIGSATSSINSNSTHPHNGYPPSYVPYKPKPPPPPAPHKSPLLSSKLPNSFPPPSNTSPSSADRSTRATPIPPLARKRYEAVFDANLANYNLLTLNGSSSNTKPALLSPTSAMAGSGRDRKGWRGLSIDLVTASEGLDMPGSELGSGDVLPGPIVRVIWSKSRLDNGRLGAIWLQLDPTRTGFLDREAFIKGMWRIDAELSIELAKRKTSSSQKSSASITASSLRTPTATPKRLPIPTSVQRNPSSSSSHSSTSSHTSHTHTQAPGLRSVRSAGSLRRVPPPPLPIPGIPSPTPPLLPIRPPTRSGTMASTTSPIIPMLPPPLPARKSTNQTGMMKPEDELDLLL